MDNRSHSEGRAFRRVWAAARLFQLLGPDPEVCNRDQPSEAICCSGTGKTDWATRDALGQPSITRDLETKGLGGNALPQVESDARCPAGLETTLILRAKVS